MIESKNNKENIAYERHLYNLLFGTTPVSVGFLLKSAFTSFLLAIFIITGNTHAQVAPLFEPIPPGFSIASSNPVYAQDIRYDNLDTNYQAFHIFLPDTTDSYPLVVYIHGGGFRAGSKDNIFSNVSLQLAAKYFLENNIGFATIGYRLLPPESASYIDSVGVIKCLSDCKRALQFIRFYSDDLFVNPAKIALRGGSAGAGTCLWLATRSDMANPSSSDPILTQSTRVCGAYLKNSQSTYDLYKWETNVFENFDGLGTNYTVDSMVAILGFDRYADFYGGIDSNYHILYDPDLIQYREDVDMLFHMSSDDPAIFSENGSAAAHPSEDLLHHSLHGLEIYNAGVVSGISEMIGVIPAQGIDNSMGETGDEFLVRILSSCSTSLSAVDIQTPNSCTIYPNPANDQIRINGLQEDEKISILSIDGALINCESSGGFLGIADLSCGVYFLVVQSDFRKEVLRFVKI